MRYFREPDCLEDVKEIFNNDGLVIMEFPFPKNLKSIILKFCNDGALDVRYTLFEDNVDAIEP